MEKTKSIKGKVGVISLSGGMDSTSLLLHLLAEGAHPYAVSFNYGQKHSIELERVQRNIEYLASQGYNIPHTIVDISVLGKLYNSALTNPDVAVPEGHYAEENMKATVVPNRNAIFSSMVYGYALSLSTDLEQDTFISLGIHSGDHCFSRNTEILTPEGLKQVKDLKIGDKIYSFNLEKNVLEEDEVLDILEKNIVPEIYSIETQAGKIELTSEHEVYKLKLEDFHPVHGYKKLIEKVKVKDLREGDYLIQPTNLKKKELLKEPILNLPSIATSILQKYESAPELKWIGEKFGLSTQGRVNEDLFISDINPKDFVSVMAWYIAEGWSSKGSYKLNEKKQTRFQASFCQSIKANLEKVEYIIEKLKNSNIPVKYEFSKTLHNDIPKEVTFYFSNIMSLFLKECGSHSEVKHIPDWLWRILLESQELREEFIRSLTLGDGNNYNEQIKGFCTTSPELLKQFITLLQLSGYHFSLNKSSCKTKYITFSKKGNKQALVSLGDAKFTQIKNIDIVNYDDHVYDISVKNNHNFFAGNYGQHLISNSIYPDCRQEFRDALNHAFQIGNWGSERVDYYTPYLEGDKFTILEDAKINSERLGLDFDVILANTNTCYNPNEKGESCGKCGSCQERLLAFNKLGVKDPVTYSTDYNQLIANVIQSEIEFQAKN